MTDETSTPEPAAVPKPRPAVKFLVCVDGSAHSRVAVRYACRRARARGGRVTLLTVIEPAENQHWMSVGNLMAEELREQAEQVLQEIAAEVNAFAGLMPELLVRVGPIGDEILRQMREDKDIGMIVLAARPPSEGPGKLVRWLASQLAGELLVPMTIVPGNLSEDDLLRLT
ncbi:MAG: universal stress protein [Tistrella sp.]|jgi:nucleotide-binding universal stress UspA family protein|uniref:Universal stress protein n=1 Tax=Tistrella mobilis TaxID=171437 RepID=A0A3B9IJV7_9PROT|nr:universal stress protein [Tistrella mobilis]MBA78290.1 universal stress protein [Tistrella sp.]HAE47613.1 universal stress protein [Tistrella mobilis]